MSFTIKSLSISYDEINESNTFTRGDSISGHVTLEVAKQTEINSFEIKAKGKASVSWSESALPMRDYYYDFEAYFKLTQDLMQETKGRLLLCVRYRATKDVLCALLRCANFPPC